MKHSFSGTWGNAWNKFPGIAPGRNYGKISGASFTRPDGTACEVTAVFLHKPGQLRLTLSHGTPEDQFPLIVKAGASIYAARGAKQSFGLGDACDYTLKSDSDSNLRVGRDTDFTLLYDERDVTHPPAEKEPASTPEESVKTEPAPEAEKQPEPEKEQAQPVIPQPVSKDDPYWDLQQRNVEQQIENALFRPTLGDGKTLVESFHDDADIEKHMLPADHGRYGLDTHTYRFSVAAQRQFWQWHFANEERIRQARLDEHERKTREFNQKIQARRDELDASKPSIALIRTAVVRKNDGRAIVRISKGAGDACQSFAIVHRVAGTKDQGPNGNWSQWGPGNIRPHKLPYEETVCLLNPAQKHEIAVIGSNRNGRVESDPVTVIF